MAAYKSKDTVDRTEAERLCNGFVLDVQEAIDAGSDDDGIHTAIETAYNKHIFENDVGLTKANFLRYLYVKCDFHDQVVNHLFTPMAWSKLKMHKCFGIKNSTTGRLVTLMRNETKDSGADFLLVECIDQPDLSPMLVRDSDAAQKFIAILNRPSTSASSDSSAPVPADDESSYSDDRVVHLDLDENINTGNLEVVDVEILFK